MFTVGKIACKNALLLAPMEDVTDVSFRLVCRESGADVAYTEFVNTEGLVRGNARTHKKLEIVDEERPVGIQIYGGVAESMVGGARIARELNPEVIDINAGCWVKNVVGCGAGAGLLKDPVRMQQMVADVVKAVDLPVTVKTRIGWDSGTINILEVARRMEDAGAQALTVHCRTRVQGHNGDADWSWIPRIKQVISIPVAVNGGIMDAEGAVRAFAETGADAVMIARGAIGNPWIFREIKELLEHGSRVSEITNGFKIAACLRHLKLGIGVKGEKRAVLEHRKFYSGYLKGMYGASRVRNAMMQLNTYTEVEEVLLQYLERLETGGSVEELFTKAEA